MYVVTGATDQMAQETTSHLDEESALLALHKLLMVSYMEAIECNIDCATHVYAELADIMRSASEWTSMICASDGRGNYKCWTFGYQDSDIFDSHGPCMWFLTMVRY